MSDEPIRVSDQETGEAIDARQAVVTAALLQVGPQDPDKYWAVVQPLLVGHPHDVSWCGGFALWCLHQARLCDWQWTVWKGAGTPSGFLYRLMPTTDPQPGDIAYFAHNQHHAIVETVPDKVGILSTINGNSLPFPQEGVVSKLIHRADVTTFYSIASLIS